MHSPKGADLTSQFSTQLRRLRLKAGMTQEGLAERSGVSVRTIRGFETGERAGPRVATVRLLADALELQPDERDELLAAAAGHAPAKAPEPEHRPPASHVQRPADALADTADELAQAVGARWQREEELRQIQDPFPLPVRWQLAPEHLMDHWPNICDAPAGGTAEPLDLAGQLDDVVRTYERIPSKRLVVLGRAGSGKTILTLRFVLDLLKNRGYADAVPVIVSLGSWNPTTATLRDWLTGQLTRDYPGLAAPGPGGSTLAAALVQTGRILPVLDGFDEMAGGLHRAALEALNADRMPLLLTSRPTEYADAVAATDVLTWAACVELTDLTRTDLNDYLPRSTRKATPTGSDTVWDPVLTELRDHPQSPASANLAAVLTTPLMVALARAIYSDIPGRDPSALLDIDRFGTPEAIEDHLLGTFIPTVYRPQPDRRRWDPDRAHHWLSNLAKHLDRLGTRDIAWWQLGTTMRRPSQMLLVALVAGLVNGLVNGLGAGLSEGLAAGLGAALAGGLAFGAAFGLAHGLVFMFGAAAFEPSGVRIQLLGRTTRARAKFVPRFMVGLAAGVAGGLVLGLWGGLGDELVGGLGTGLVGGLGVGLAFGLVCGLVAGLMARFEVPIDIRSTASPADLLATNRNTVVFQSLVWGPVFGLGVGLVGGLVDGLAFGLVIGIGVGIGHGLSLTAWGQWVVFSRIWLPLTGRLPWAVTAFLDDACRRGVLRQAGAVYQFRHARLQDHLTGVREH
jgi:transcriptional regulator with XRE-family HTH domain